MVGAKQYCRIVTIVNAFRYLFTENTLVSGFFQVEMSCKWVFCISFFANTLVSQSAGSLNANAQDGQMMMMMMMIHSNGNMRKLSWTENTASRSRDPCGSRWWNYPAAVWWAANESHLSSGRLWSRADRSWWGFVWKTWAGCDRTSFKCYMLHCINQQNSLWTQPGISTSTRVDDAAATARK